jgi:hypothetical protein
MNLLYSDDRSAPANLPQVSDWYVAYCGNSGDYFTAYFNKETSNWKNASGDVICFGDPGRAGVGDKWCKLGEEPEGACVESSVPPKEPVVNFPYVYASIDKPSGLHALWLVVKDELGVVKPIAGPEPWPEGWTKLYAEAYDAALNK